MPKFIKGDKVLVNGSQVAVVDVYDEGSGQLVLVQELAGNATNTIYGPIGSYRLEHLIRPAEGSILRPGEEAEESTEVEPTVSVTKGDEITTSAFL